MIREIVHFARQLPELGRMQVGRTQAEMFELLMDTADEHGLGELRAELVAPIRGKTLEIGCGTGRMFPHYSSYAHVVAIEPDDSFRALAMEPAEKAAARIEVRAAPGEQLPFDDDSFDDVIVAMVLCSVDSVNQVLTEIRRVLRPGGSVHLMEHVVSNRAIPAAAMHLTNPLWLLLNRQGCNMNRDPLPAIRSTGFEVTEERPYQLFAPYLPAFPSKLIRARLVAT